MEAILVIAVVGLALALAAALLALRRRAAEMDALVAAASAASAMPDGAAPAAPAPDPLDDLLPVGVLRLGRDRRVARANTRAHALLEVAPGRLVGRTVMEAFLDARLDTLVDGLEAGTTTVTETRLGAGDSRRVVLHLHYRPGEGTWIVLEDVTELRRLQQIRAEFIDNLSHELRTPLSTVSLLAETLARDAETADVPPRMRERIAKVEIETGHLVQMVNELLDLARIEGGTQLRLADDVDLGRLAAASVERLRLFAERQGVSLTVTADPAAPRVRGDEDRLGQVFVNLVHNAVKFSPDGGDVTVHVRPEGGEVITTVTETRLGAGDSRRVVLHLHYRPGEGTWIVLEDVTELRRLQQIRAEFIDNLSHELRTPLSTVSLLAETLARDAETADVPPRMRERIAKVEIETGHLVQMVNELLDLARIEGGTQLRLADDVDLGRLAAASVERLRLFAERQGVSLTVTADPAAPRVRGDEDRLGQVFVNLVHNAVKFSPDGGDVTVHVRPEGGEVIVSVTDHGIGIPKRDQPRIFERFYKVDRARVRGGGTGLGLSIARHVVERHGGRIWLESEEGRGSTFSFAIPVTVST
ncbi:MAG: hypothetical protein A2V85_00675 [Chloroflexi bacterium RBG_16_72_14]|nr:MAG: hypothetical protein A2V85_00675 [Chloroflexi bacterium RBG_16_72_14]